jgi:cell division protein FtsB
MHATDPTVRSQVRRGGHPFRTVLIIAGLFLCFLIVDTLVGDRGLVALMRARQDYRHLADQVAAIRAENARLRDEMQRLRDDPAAIEEIARRDLGLIRPGEKLFIIRDLPPAAARR